MASNDPARETPLPDNRLAPQDFFADVAAALAAELEDTIGLAEASSFVGQVGDDLGTAIGQDHAGRMGGLQVDPAPLAALLADLKHRIGGGFEIDSVSADEIVLVNSACPFGIRARGRPSLCMMTTNVFGRIVADARGYARIEVEEAIAAGHGRCRVRIGLRGGGGGEGFEFFR